jgi:HK97 family phage major capsid protein
MTIAQLIAQLRGQMAAKLEQRNTHATELATLRSAPEVDEAKVAEIRAAKDALDAELDLLEARVADLTVEQARDDAADRLSREVHPTGAGRPAYDEVARTGAEERTYAAHKERGFDQKRGALKPGSKAGGQFERDVAAAFLGDYAATERLQRHMAEERVERAEWLSRAAGTGAFAGLTVPQYLTDLYAPAVAAMRPFADACNKHELPAAGMTVNISRITTATSAALQASENTAVSETNIDDTLLTLNVQTVAGQQTLSRQALERGTGVEPVVMDDLFRRYASTLDSTLLNQATTGLAASSSVIAYTSAAPKVVEYYPIAVSALAAVEAAMLDQASGQNLAIMHSRRWYWLQNGLSATWPLISQPGIAAQMAAGNFDATYLQGVRGILPNGTPVIVDNNVTTIGLAGATTGGTQDHTYVVDQKECHLWEDPGAPLFIRAEQPSAAALGVLLVVYGYMAYTFSRYSQAQLISGTGTVTPAFTGV